MKTNYQLSGALGIGLLALLWSMFMLEAIALLLGGSLAPWIFWISLILGGCTSWILAQRKVKTVGSYLTVVVVSIALAFIVTDASWDGNYYHQEAIDALVSGYNPYIDATHENVWVQHYAKGIEMMAATIVSATGNLETGKAVNLLIILSSSLICVNVLRFFRPNMSRRMFICSFLIIACNPICIGQVFTYYIDYAKYCWWIIAIASIAALYARHPHRLLWCSVLVVSTILAAATKFNMFFEQGLLIFAILLWTLCQRRPKIAREIFVSAVVALLLCLLFCYHPYVTNYLTAHHPLYPLMGDGAIDIMSGNTPEVFKNMDRFTAFVYSLSYPGITTYAGHIGGFGVFMPLIILASLVMLVLKYKSIPSWSKALMLFTVASCLFYPQSWWARYICQFWIIPVIIYIFTAPDKKIVSFLCKSVFVLTLLNATIMMGGVLRNALNLEMHRRAVVYALDGDRAYLSGYIPHEFIKQMHDRGISDVSVVDSVTPDAVTWFGIADNYDYPHVCLSPDQWERYKQYPFRKFVRIDTYYWASIHKNESDTTINTSKAVD